MDSSRLPRQSAADVSTLHASGVGCRRGDRNPHYDMRVSRVASVKRQFGHRARLGLSPAEVSAADAQAHAARTMWNLLHAWWQMMPKDRRTLANADAAIRQSRKDVDFLAVLPAQAAQAVLKAYFQAWKNCWEGRADAPNFKGRFRSVMSVDIPQGRDLNVKRVHRRWGMVNLPKIGRVRFRWTKGLPVGRRADRENRITGARLVKDALGWHIAFRVMTQEPAPDPHTGPEVGIDVGVIVPLALSDGTAYEHGAWLTERVPYRRAVLAAADGHRSAVRQQLGADHAGPRRHRVRRRLQRHRRGPRRRLSPTATGRSGLPEEDGRHPLLLQGAAPVPGGAVDQVRGVEQQPVGAVRDPYVFDE